MPWLAPSDRFDPDTMNAPVIGIASRLLQHDSGSHQHRRGQLLFCYSGSLRITLPGWLSMLPPVRVAWIPPDTEHQVRIRGEVAYRSIYLDTTRIAPPAAEPAILAMNPLLRELFERISHAPFEQDWSTPPARHLLALCLHELTQARHEPMLLPVPCDRRFAALDLEQLPPDMETLARQVGASSRTISRVFQRDTGMGYQSWRQLWRLLRAVDLLGSGANSSRVAFDLGFSSDSAFIAFFKQMTGTTPRRYLAGD